MATLHQGLEERWARMPLVEQMANIGSEVGRALGWKEKGNSDYSRKAMERALELLDMTLASVRDYPRLKELARTRECLVDYFYGRNEYGSTEEGWTRYFLAFNYAARRNS